MKVYREITPLNLTDVFVLLDSINNGFDYPLHNHPEYEITLIDGSSGTRMVGDSMEKYFEHDLALLGPLLHHKWDGDDRTQKNAPPCRVITLQFDLNLFDSQLFGKAPFYKIKKLLEDASRGLRFSGNTFLKAKEKIINLSKLTGMKSVLEFLDLMNFLAQSGERSYLASEGFNIRAIKADSRRIKIAYQYILKNFTENRIKMGDVAKKVNMTDSAFSHFFKKNTNKSFTQFLIDMRLGYACRMLIDTDDSISEIAFQSGFNNLTNFNRLFKKYRGCTPLQYRKFYKEKNVFDWTDQLTPFQFLPSNKKLADWLKPTEYTTKLVHP